MATLTGILIGLGRLSSDREAVAMLACGVSPYRLLRPVLAFALVTTGATAYVMFQGIPDANQTFREITWELVSKRVETDVQPRVFFEDFPNYVLYSRDVAPEGGWKDVLVADSSTPGSTKIVMAARGRLVLNPGSPPRRPRPDQRHAVHPRRQRADAAPTGSKATSASRSMPTRSLAASRLPRQLTEKTIAELRADARHQAQSQGRRAVAASRDHLHPAEVLDPGRLPGLCDHRPRARPELGARRQDGRLRRRPSRWCSPTTAILELARLAHARALQDDRSRRRAPQRQLPASPTLPGGGRTSSWACSGSAPWSGARGSRTAASRFRCR